MGLKIDPAFRAASGPAHLDRLLDEALEETFPASDPIAINFEEGKTRTGQAAVSGKVARRIPEP
jgi:hypothetical protein